MPDLTRHLPLNTLRGFEAAARLESFSGAAEELGMTQSAISHQIRSLEDHLGQSLFNRVNRRAVLSDAGHDLLLTVQESFQVLGEGVRRLDQYKKPNQVIVHTSSAFATTWLMPRLDAFRRRHPELDIWLFTSDRELNLETEEVHLAILSGERRWPGLSVELLLTEQLLPVCAPDLIRAPDRIEAAADLLCFPLLHGERWETWHSWFALAGVTGVNPVAGPNFTDPAILLQAARQGQGIALGSSILAREDLQAGRLICPYDLRLESSQSYFTVGRGEDLERPKVRHFLSWLRQEAEDFQARSKTASKPDHKKRSPRRQPLQMLMKEIDA